MRYFLILLLGFQSLASGRELPVTPIETLRQQAIDAYRAKNFPEAENLFFQVLAKDDHAKSATFAVDYLKKILIEGGSTEKALKVYDELQGKGKIEEAFRAVPQSYLDQLKQPLKLQEHLASLFKLGGIALARTSLLGVILDGLGFQNQAGYFLSQAKNLADQSRDHAYEIKRQKLSVRPLHYLYPEFYNENLKLPKRFPGQFQIVTFADAREDGINDFYGKNLNDWYTTLNFNYFVNRNSNVQKNSGGIDALSNDYALTLATQKNLTLPKSFGFDYTLIAHRYFTTAFEPYNGRSHLLSAWLSFLSKQNYELRLRYDFSSNTGAKGGSEYFDTIHGPALAFSYFWNRLYLIDALYSFKSLNSSNSTAQGTSLQNETDHALTLKVAYPGKEKTLQPYVLYHFDRSLSEGVQTNFVSHQIGTGTVYLLGESTALNFEASYRYKMFALNSDTEQIRSIKMDLSLPVVDLFSILMGSAYEAKTSTLATSNYTDLKFTLGLSFNLSI